jgi:hypothetical protein
MAEELSGTPLKPVYIAGNMADAERAERVLTERGIDYAVSLEPFTNSSAMGAVLGGTYAGLFFYVPAAQHESSRALLSANGFVDTIGPELSLENTHGA